MRKKSFELSAGRCLQDIYLFFGDPQKDSGTWPDVVWNVMAEKSFLRFVSLGPFLLVPYRRPLKGWKPFDCCIRCTLRPLICGLGGVEPWWGALASSAGFC